MFSKIVNSIIEEFSLPAIAVGIIVDKKVSYKATYGVCSYTSNQAITEHTLFQIASLSKEFLGMLIARLVDEEILKWDDKIAHLSLYQIACMQTGLKEKFANVFINEGHHKDELTEVIIEQVTNIKQSIYKQETYAQYTYQYALLLLLEEIIKRKTGIIWEQLLSDKLLRPLALYNTGIDITQVNNTNNLAVAHDKNNNVVEWETFQVNSAAGIYSNLNDMLTWLKFHLSEGVFNNTQLISQNEIQKINNPCTKIQQIDLSYSLGEIISASYGYFWYNFYLKLGNKILTLIEHNGECSGMSSLISYLPKEQIGLVILCNKETPGVKKLRKQLLEHVLYNSYTNL